MQGRRHRQGNEGDHGHTSDPVSLETVRSRSYTVTGIVTGTVGNNPRISRVIFLDAEHDLHQVGTDIGDLGKNTAGDTQGAGTQGLTDGETDETGSCQFTGNKQEDDKHHDQLNTDQKDPDAHASIQGDIQHLKGLSLQGVESHPAIGQGVHADTVPGHTI